MNVLAYPVKFTYNFVFNSVFITCVLQNFDHRYQNCNDKDSVNIFIIWYVFHLVGVIGWYIAILKHEEIII